MWHKTMERSEIVFDNIGGHVDCEYFDFVYIFCPKCQTRRKYRKDEWELVQREMQIMGVLSEVTPTEE